MNLVSNRRFHLLLLFCLAVTVNTVVYLQLGVKIVNDSERYLTYAAGLHQGFYIDPFNIWYVTYPFFIFLIDSVGGNTSAVIATQYLLNIASVFALYQCSVTIWKNNLGALVTAALFILFKDIAQWNSYILTESLYCSMICFSMLGLSLLTTKKRPWYMYVAVGIVIGLTFFTKPTGIAIVGALLMVSVIWIVKRIPSKVFRLVVCCAIGGSLLLLANLMLANYLVMENYQKGEIIYDVTTLPESHPARKLVITPPDDLYKPSENYQPLLRIILFIVHHPWYWLKLSLSKIFFLVSNVRPYWSLVHNIYNVVILAPVYFFFVKGIRSEANSLVKIFSLAYVAIQILAIAITSEDWDGRFIIPMLPVIFLWAPRGYWASKTETTAFQFD